LQAREGLRIMDCDAIQSELLTKILYSTVNLYQKDFSRNNEPVDIIKVDMFLSGHLQSPLFNIMTVFFTVPIGLPS